MPRHPLARAATALLPVAAGTALADGPYPRSSHELAIGVTRQKAESSTLASVPSLPAIALDLEDLGVNSDHDSWYAQYGWRFRERWLLEAFAYQFEDGGRIAATRDFNYDGVEFTAGAIVDSTLEIDTYALDLLYAVHQGPRAELLLGGGIHALDLSASFTGLVSVANETQVFARSGDTLLAPVPNLRGRGTFAFNDWLGADFTVGWLSAEVDDYDGSFLYAHARLRCRLGDSSSIAVGYQYTKADISREPGNGRKQKFDADLYGPSLQLSFSF